MKIYDTEHILTNKEPVRRAISHHPLHPMLSEWIEEVCISDDARKCSAGARIEYDEKTRSAILYLARQMPKLPEYEYVLLHEFTHVGDRVDPFFNYSDAERNALSDTAQIKLMELWNIYIDSRLNGHGMFALGTQDRDVYCTIDGKLQKAPYSIEGKLLRHTSFLRSREMPEAEEAVRAIWNSPRIKRTYRNLIALANNVIRQ